MNAISVVEPEPEVDFLFTSEAVALTFTYFWIFRAKGRFCESCIETKIPKLRYALKFLPVTNLDYMFFGSLLPPLETLIFSSLDRPHQGFIQKVLTLSMQPVHPFDTDTLTQFNQN